MVAAPSTASPVAAVAPPVAAAAAPETAAQTAAPVAAASVPVRSTVAPFASVAPPVAATAAPVAAVTDEAAGALATPPAESAVAASERVQALGIMEIADKLKENPLKTWCNVRRKKAGGAIPNTASEIRKFAAEMKGREVLLLKEYLLN